MNGPGRLFLESGLPFAVTNVISVRHPKVQDILGLGDCSEKIYWEWVAKLLADPYQNMVWLDDNGIDYEEVDCFDVFCLQWNILQDAYLQHRAVYDQLGYNPLWEITQALCFFLGEGHAFRLKKSGDGEFVLEDPSLDHYHVGREEYKKMAGFIRRVNGISYEGRIKPRDKASKRILIEDTREELGRKRNRSGEEENQDFLGDMTACVLHAGNGAINPFNFREASIFSIISAYKVIYKKFNADHMLTGVYSGTIKSESMNHTDMDWAK